MMKKSPKVSCIMTTFNSAEFLQESIESVLNQTFNDFEFIISDWGSSDNTVKIIKNYQKNDSRIILLENKKRKGIADCLNDCMKIAKGEYIAIMESDDVSYLNRFEAEYDILKNVNIDLVMTARESGIIMGKEKNTKVFYHKNNFLNISYCLNFPPLIACWMFKRDLFKRIGWFCSYTWDVRFSYDACFINPRAELSFIDRILYFKRDNSQGASLSKKFSEDLLNNKIYAIKKYWLSKTFILRAYLGYYINNIIHKLHISSIVSFIRKKIIIFRFYKK